MGLLLDIVIGVGVKAGMFHTMALKNDGTLWTWGDNDKGELGDGTRTNRLSPIQVGNSNNWASISVGNEYSMAIKTDGTLWAWGDNGWGKYGNGE